MPPYRVAIYRPDDYDPFVETDTMSREIDALNEEMVAAGVRKFVARLPSPVGRRSRYAPCCDRRPTEATEKPGKGEKRI